MSTHPRRGELPVVTLLGRRYAVRRGWGSWPDWLPRGFVSQVAVDAGGRVHLLQRERPAILVFEPSGAFAFSYGDQIGDGHGIYCDRDNRIFVTDRDSHQVIAFTADGNELFRLGERHRPRWREPFNHPTDIAVSHRGALFVSDGYGNARVHRFDANGRHETSWGELGRGPAEFLTPHAVWATDDDRVLVADRENGCVKVFDPDGERLGAWHGMQNPMDIWVDANGFAFVTDQVPSLLAFAPDGTLAGRCRPSLNGAHGIFGTPAGDFFLAEMNPASITKLERLDDGGD